MIQDMGLVTIRTFLDVFEAEVARGALEAAGIEAVVRSDDAGGLHPGMWTARGVRLIVRQEDAEAAERALETFTGPLGIVAGDSEDPG
jgi:hypothetical protein